LCFCVVDTLIKGEKFVNIKLIRTLI
jgi:hypothetical protein